MDIFSDLRLYLPGQTRKKPATVLLCFLHLLISISHGTVPGGKQGAHVIYVEDVKNIISIKYYIT